MLEKETKAFWYIFIIERNKWNMITFIIEIWLAQHELVIYLSEHGWHRKTAQEKAGRVGES